MINMTRSIGFIIIVINVHYRTSEINNTGGQLLNQQIQ